MKLDLQKFAAASDQRAAILEATANALPGIDVFRNRVLVATYVTPERTAGGIIRPDRNIEESRYQGKVGLVLKFGPIAFKFENEEVPVVPEIGEWVFYRAADTWEAGICGVSCRFVYDDHIVGRCQNPEWIY